MAILAVAYILFGWILSFFDVLSYDTAFINTILTGIFITLVAITDILGIRIGQDIEDIKREIRSKK